MLFLLRISYIENKIRRLTRKREILCQKYIRKCENKWKNIQKEQN